MDEPNPDNQLTPSPNSQPLSSSETEAVTPPTPGQVVSAGSSAVPPAVQTVSAIPSAPTDPAAAPSVPPAQVITSNHGGGKKRWLKAFLLLVIIALLAAGGLLAYQKHHKQAAPVTTQSKDIPLLKIGILQATYGNLYPDMSVNEYGYLTNAQMFEGLVRYENTNKIVPDLASNWTNPDSKTWLFTVKNGVKFHDGHTLAASDVKYSLDKIIASKSDFAQTFASTIASVETVGTNQVKITTTNPDPALLNRLAFLYIIDANLPQGDEPSQAGTGPYEVKPGTKPTDTNIQMVAFNQYHGGTPKTKALDFGSGKDDTALLKDFQNHTYNIVGPMAVNDAKKVSGATQFVTTEPDVNYLAFNTVKAGPLQNKLVREAIRYAVDPKAIDTAGGNLVTPLSQLIPESIPGYNPAIAPYKQNAEKAKQLLAQAGYPNGLTIRLSTADDPQKDAEIVKQLKQVGITVNVDQHSNFDEFINYFNSGQAEMYSVDYSSDTLDGLDIYNATLDSNNYSNPQLTNLLNQASTTTDPAKRLKLLQDAAVIVDQDVAVVPIGSEDNLWLMDKNYAIHQDMPSSLVSAYFYKTHLK